MRNLAIRSFINEFGNQIRISVEKHEGQLQIYVQGPYSTMENNITKMEAMELISVLSEVLYADVRTTP